MTKTIRKGDSLSPDGACLLSHAAQPKNPATLEPTHYEVPQSSPDRDGMFIFQTGMNYSALLNPEHIESKTTHPVLLPSPCVHSEIFCNFFKRIKIIDCG